MFGLDKCEVEVIVMSLKNTQWMLKQQIKGTGRFVQIYHAAWWSADQHERQIGQIITKIEGGKHDV